MKETAKYTARTETIKASGTHGKMQANQGSMRGGSYIPKALIPKCV